MNTKQLRQALIAVPNLSQLSRDSGIPLITLRRLRNGHTDPRLSTVERLTQHLPKKKEKAHA